MAFFIPGDGQNLNCQSTHSRHCNVGLTPKPPILLGLCKFEKVEGNF